MFPFIFFSQLAQCICGVVDTLRVSVVFVCCAATERDAMAKAIMMLIFFIAYI